MPTDPAHAAAIRALEDRTYSSLTIKVINGSAYLVVGIEGEEHVFVDRFGKSKMYEHIWQPQDWLWHRFGILPASIPVVKLW